MSTTTTTERDLMALGLRCITLLCVLVILTIGSCVAHSDFRRAQALEDGVSPVGVECAFGTAGNTCGISAAQERSL